MHLALIKIDNLFYHLTYFCYYYNFIALFNTILGFYYNILVNFYITFSNFFFKTDFDGILVISFNYVGPMQWGVTSPADRWNSPFFWLLPGLAIWFTLTFSLSFCSLPSDAITHNPLPHSLTSPTSLNQHKFTSLTFSETQPLYQTPVVQFISLSHAWQHLLRE